MRGYLVSACLFLALAASASVAVAAGPVVPATWGTTDQSSVVVNAWQFTTVAPGDGWAYKNGGLRYLTTPGAALIAPVAFPNGALLTEIEIQGCAAPAETDLRAMLQVATVFPTFAQNDIVMASLSQSTTACGRWRATLSIPHQVDNELNTYFVTVDHGNVVNGDLALQAVRIFYRLQVSPAPESATFADVPVGHALHQYVEALVAAGITAGCGGGNFCPGASVTRGQMAVFLAKALGLHWPN